jgi:hypothetical protein
MTEMMMILLAVYEANATATEYWFGFILNHSVYVVTGLTLAELSRFFRAERMAQSKGGYVKIRIKARVGELAELLPRAIRLGGEEILQDPKWNAGIKFEKIVTERIACQEWARDSVPFWIAPDIEMGARKIQVKFNGAELTNERTIRNNFPGCLR